MLLGTDEQHLAEGREALDDLVRLATTPQPQVGGHLIVARACSVQLSPDLSYDFGQTRLDVHVDVLFLRIPHESAALDLLGYLLQTAHELFGFARADDSRPRQPFGVGDRAVDVFAPELRVDVDALVQALHGAVDRCGQAPTARDAHASPDPLLDGSPWGTSCSGEPLRDSASRGRISCVSCSDVRASCFSSSSQAAASRSLSPSVPTRALLTLWRTSITSWCSSWPAVTIHVSRRTANSSTMASILGPTFAATPRITEGAISSARRLTRASVLSRL